MIENQAYLFLVFSLTGVILGIIFDFFRVLRKTFKTTDFITCIEDIIYWILAGLIILYNIWFFNEGEIRVYIILGIIMGAIIYALTISPIFVKVDYFIMKIIKKILIKLAKFFKFILTTFSKIFKVPIKFVKNILQKLENFIKKQNNKGNFESNGE